MKLTEDIYEFIKGEVVALFNECTEKRIPISGLYLANEMKIQIIPYSSFCEDKKKVLMKFDKDGFFTDYNGKEKILYNDEVNYERMNMTILHEIGHCVLGHTSESNHDQAEAEARFFAKYALAPPPLIYLIKAKNKEDIEKTFGLSKQASEFAFEYYMKWLRKKKRTLKLESYEKNLIIMFKNYGKT